MYEIGELITIFDSNLGPHRVFKGEEYYYTCPFCYHYNPKLAVNLMKRAWHCWHCKKAGRSLQLLLRAVHAPVDDIRAVNRLIDEIPTESEQEETFDLALPEEFRPMSEHSQSWKYDSAASYLHERKISPLLMLRYNIGYCDGGPYDNRIIVPSYGADGKLNYFVARSTISGPLKYLTPKISKNVIGFESEINWRHPIILTEGVFDAIMARRNAIPLFGTYIPRKLKEKIIQEGTKEVYLALDKDALQQTLTVAETLIRMGVAVYVVNMTDKDPGQLGFTKTQDLIRKATPLTFSNLVEYKLQLV